MKSTFAHFLEKRYFSSTAFNMYVYYFSLSLIAFDFQKIWFIVSGSSPHWSTNFVVVFCEFWTILCSIFEPGCFVTFAFGGAYVTPLLVIYALSLNQIIYLITILLSFFARVKPISFPMISKCPLIQFSTKDFLFRCLLLKR